MRDALRIVSLAATVASGTCGPAAPTSQDLFDSKVLQRVDLQLAPGDWETLKDKYLENTYYRASFTWDSLTVRNIGVRSRGLGSRYGAKPGLRVDFDRYEPEQELLGLRSIVLDNLAQDPSGVREVVAMRFLEKIGIFTPRESHALLFVNGEYAGLFAIVESIDKRMLARLFGSIAGNIQNDGFLFEYRYQMESPWRFEYEGPALDGYKSRFIPRTRENQSDSEVWGPIEELVRLVDATPPETFEQAVRDRIDLAGLVRLLAAQNFVAEEDGFLGYAGMNNFYLYRLEGRRTHAFIVWDQDHAFGRPDLPIDRLLNDNALTRKVLSIPAYRRQYYDALLQIADIAQRDDSLLHQLRQQLELIDEAMHRDPSKPYPNEVHAAARDQVLAFPAARVAYVKCEVLKRTAGPLPASCDHAR